MRNFILIFCLLGMWKISLAQTNTFPSTGNVGIGIASPQAELHVIGSIYRSVTNTSGYSYSPVEEEGFVSKYNGTLYPAGIYFWNSFNSNLGHWISFKTSNNSGSAERLRIDKDGNVGIGTTSPTEKLAVNGKIRAKEINVETGWADFVFEPAYKLRSLKETEQFIKNHGHLPEIPSAKEVEANGINVGEMNAKLLQKIEELTLHLINQDKKLQQQQMEINELRAKL